MKRCLACNAAFTANEPHCPKCGARIEAIDGFLSFAPEPSGGGGGFRPEHFAQLVALEAGNFWFRARNRLIIWALKKYCSGVKSFMEIGCGTGFVLSGIAKAFPGCSLSGSEIFIAGLPFAAKRLPGTTLMQIDARKIPFVKEFDAMGAFDVIEHIEEDETVLAQMHSALKPGGILLLTVPQHRWLWSPVDEMACHVRRYSASELYDKTERAGFEILHSTSFVSVLLPAMMLSRRMQSSSIAQAADVKAELAVSPWLNSVFEIALGMEFQLIRLGVQFPFGGSRLLVARRREDSV